MALIAECSLLTNAVSLGYGKHSWDVTWDALLELLPFTASSGVFAICAAIWSKTSFALTLIRLTEGKLKIAIWVIIVTMNIAMGISAMLPFVDCNPVQRSWNPNITTGSCWPLSVIVNYDIFSAGEL